MAGDTWCQKLQVFRFETGPLCNSGEHPWTDFLIIMKCKYKIRPAGTKQRTRGTCLSFNDPTDAKKCGQNGPARVLDHSLMRPQR